MIVQGKVAIVTGGAKGIGATSRTPFLREARSLSSTTTKGCCTKPCESCSS